MLEAPICYLKRKEARCSLLDNFQGRLSKHDVLRLPVHSKEPLRLSLSAEAWIPPEHTEASFYPNGFWRKGIN